MSDPTIWSDMQKRHKAEKVGMLTKALIATNGNCKYAAIDLGMSPANFNIAFNRHVGKAPSFWYESYLNTTE